MTLSLAEPHSQAVRCPDCGSLDIDISGRCRAVHAEVRAIVANFYDAIGTKADQVIIGCLKEALTLARLESERIEALELILRDVVCVVPSERYPNLFERIDAVLALPVVTP